MTQIWILTAVNFLEINQMITYILAFHSIDSVEYTDKEISHQKHS